MTNNNAGARHQSSEAVSAEVQQPGGKKPSKQFRVKELCLFVLHFQIITVIFLPSNSLVSPNSSRDGATEEEKSLYEATDAPWWDVLKVPGAFVRFPPTFPGK